MGELLGINNNACDTGGYICGNCGGWVTYGIAHSCYGGWLQQPVVANWMWPVTSPKRFNGTLKSLEDLPAGEIGDSYYVEKAAILVIRGSEGWIIVPKDEPDA